MVLAILFLCALAIRLYDLTDLPLDFHPTRQLISVMKARGMYYQGRVDAPEWQRRFAVQQWKGRAEIEPEIIERLHRALDRHSRRPSRRAAPRRIAMAAAHPADTTSREIEASSA